MSRTIVITGCSSGLGRDAAQQLARKGDRVSVVGVDFGVRALNASTEPYDAALLESMGLTSFATLASQRS